MTRPSQAATTPVTSYAKESCNTCVRIISRRRIPLQLFLLINVELPILQWIVSVVFTEHNKQNTTGMGAVAAGQQWTRAPTNPAGAVPGRVWSACVLFSYSCENIVDLIAELFFAAENRRFRLLFFYTTSDR